MRELDENNVPTKEFYFFLRYNKIFEKEKIEILNEYDEEYFNEYKRLHKELKIALDNNDNNLASSIHGAIQSMFGFSRHYCSVTGAPILSSYFKIGAKIVCKEAYDSYLIIQEMEKKNLIRKEKENIKLQKENKYPNKTKKEIV